MKTYDIKSIMLGIGLGLVIASILNINIYGNFGNSISDDVLKTEATKRGFIIYNPEDIINKKTIDSNNGDNKSKTNNYENNDEIKIQIMKGYDALETAKVLFNNGLIKDIPEFVHRLEEKNKDKKIQYGTYIIKNGTSYDDIIEIITIP
ncbi:MAG TPA: endolytic transglycosylase MltG [Clostridiales bacterium]|nr:endolytic transglycosylase MltG [Clostridiales bacterium]